MRISSKTIWSTTLLAGRWVVVSVTTLRRNVAAPRVWSTNFWTKFTPDSATSRPRVQSQGECCKNAKILSFHSKSYFLFEQAKKHLRPFFSIKMSFWAETNPILQQPCQPLFNKGQCQPLFLFFLLQSFLQTHLLETYGQSIWQVCLLWLDLSCCPGLTRQREGVQGRFAPLSTEHQLDIFESQCFMTMFETPLTTTVLSVGFHLFKVSTKTALGVLSKFTLLLASWCRTSSTVRTMVTTPAWK